MKKIIFFIVLFFCLCQEVRAYTVDSLEYTYRKKITIQNANIDADQSNFPVYVKISADVEIGDNSNADGFDIRFTQSDGTTLLKYERESWTGGAGADATADFWVKSNVTTASATDIYIYYRSTDTADGADPTNVWDTNFKGVWHLKEDPSGGAPQMYDSTANNNDGTSAGTMTSEDQVAGKVDGSLDFEGTDDYINVGDVANADGTLLTLSYWLKPDAFQGYQGHIVKEAANFSSMDWGIYGDAATVDEVYVQIGSGDFHTSNANLSTSAWQMLAFSYNGGGATNADKLKTYKNAVLLSGTFDVNIPTSISATANPVFIANKVGATAPYKFFDGLIDEVRISSSARSASWIKFEYYNMNEGDNELTWGTQESEAVGHGQVIFINEG